MLDLISFAVEVVGLDYVIEAVSRPPSLPAFLLHPPSSLSYPEIPLFDQLRHQLLTSAAIHGPSTFLQFVIFMVDEFHIDRVLGHRQPRRPRGGPPSSTYMVNPNYSTEALRRLDLGKYPSISFS